MDAKKPFENFRAVWARVEAAGRRDMGSAKLMPRRDRTSRATRHLPPDAPR